MLCTVFDTAKIVNELTDLEKQESAPNFYLDANLVKQVGRRKRELTDLHKKINDANSYLNYLEDLINNFSDEELENIGGVQNELVNLKNKVDDLYVSTLYTGKWDNEDCMLEIHSGAGGEEAQDWAEMLYRMYIRYSDIMGYSVKVVDSLAGIGAGLKSISLVISGSKAYGNLINEKGVHRLVRISPFDANKRRHTSFASVDVSPMIDQTPDITISPDEIKIDTYRSGGAGGQHVNKTESAVRITHLPTGIIVQCQNERSQLQNKEYALKMLASKLAQKHQAELDEQRAIERGEAKKIEWGSQIRSYVLHPYNMVKDHRTNYQTSDTTAVLNGDIQQFIIENLIKNNKQ